MCDICSHDEHYSQMVFLIYKCTFIGSHKPHDDQLLILPDNLKLRKYKVLDLTKYFHTESEHAYLWTYKKL